MRGLSFLGTGKYNPVTYWWQDAQGERSCRTHLFPEAVAEIFRPEQLVVFVTPPVKVGEHLQTLRERLGDVLQPVDIPEGKSEAELWEIFERVTAAVAEGETILLDVTHAFRSLPMVVFTIAAYLRRAKSVHVERVVYGAYEARDENNRAPIFDLTPLLELLDWTSGAEALLKRGDAGLIADKMITTHQILYRTGAGIPVKLKTLGQKLQALSQALHLSRPREIMRLAHELLPLLEQTRAEFKQWAKPFALLASQIWSELEPLAFDRPDELSRENLEKQLWLVEYYLKKGLVVQAVTLAREWMVSYALLLRGAGDWLQRADRAEAEKALGAAATRAQREDVEPPGWFAQLPRSAELARFWGELSNLRNALAHCAMSHDAPSISTVEQNAQKLPQALRSLLDLAPDIFDHEAK